MAGPNLTTHIPIYVAQTISGNTPDTQSIIEKAGQTFLFGVPVQIGGTGAIQEWDGATVAAGIAGVSLVAASNLASDGAGSPGAFQQVGFPGASPTFGKVPFQPSAVNIPRGAPFVDGRTIFTLASQDIIYEAQVDNSAGNVAADYTPVATDVGKEFGMTKDANGQWYVDRGKTTVGTNTVVIVKEIEPNDLSPSVPGAGIINARVRFVIKDAASQIIH